MIAKQLNLTMVKAVLKDKTQTRVLMNPQPTIDDMGNLCYKGYNYGQTINSKPNFSNLAKCKSPYKVGDVLGIRERARLTNWVPNSNHGDSKENGIGTFLYEADQTTSEWIEIPERLKPLTVGHCVPNGCFKELIRLFLKITAVKAPERFCDISEADAIAEGVCRTGGGRYWIAAFDAGFIPRATAKEAFLDLIESIYPGRANHWCFPFDFEITEKGQ